MVLAVRQLQTRGEWWEAAGCVEHTERVQLHLHVKLVAIQTEARPAVQSTQPADALHELCAIHTVSRVVAWACSGRGAAICVRVSSSVNHL